MPTAPTRGSAPASGWWWRPTRCDGTFLKLPADVAIVTNVDPEHLDHFKTFEAVQDAFRNFVENVPFYGFAVMCIDHPVVQSIVGNIEDRRIITYGENPQADARLIDLDSRWAAARSFTVVFRDRADRCRACDRRPHAADAGTAQRAQRHGGDRGARMNSAFADETIRKALASFGGVRRRFTKTGEWNGVTIIDDYGHHPVEIAAVLKAARGVHQRQDHRRGAAASLHAAAIAVRGVLHLLQRRRHRRRRAKSIRPARRRYQASTATNLCSACARTAIAK